MFAPHTLPVDVLALWEYSQVCRMDYFVRSKDRSGSGEPFRVDSPST